MDSSKCELPLVRVSLCGVTSLCDVLPQLSLPSPLPTTADKSLLFSSTAADKAQMVGKHFSDLLLQSVTEAIDSVSTQHIELKADRGKVQNNDGYIALVQTVLKRTPQVFNNIARPGLQKQREQKQKTDFSVNGLVGADKARSNNAAASSQSPVKGNSSFMMKNVLKLTKEPDQKEEASKDENSSTVKNQEELDFLLAQSLAGGGIAERSRSRASKTSVSDSKTPLKNSSNIPDTSPVKEVKIKPRNMKKSGLKPARMNLKKHQKKQSFAFSSDDENETPDKSDAAPSTPASSDPIVSPEKEPKGSVFTSPAKGSVFTSPVKGSEFTSPSKSEGFGPAEIEEPASEEEVFVEEPEEVKDLCVESESQKDEEEEEVIDVDDQGQDDYQPMDEDDEEVEASEEEEEEDEYIPAAGKAKKICLKKSGEDGKKKTKTLREIQVEKAEQRKKESQKAQTQLNLEDDMVDPLESATFKRFCKLLDIIFEHEDEMVPDGFKLSTQEEDEEDDYEPSPDTLLSLRKLGQLSAEAAKLKAMKVLNCIPQDRLVRLLNILDRHIRDSMRLPLNPEPETLETDLHTYQRETLQRMQVSAEACIASLHILTCPDMPKAVYLEDVIERTVVFIKYHLVHDIYPNYDPVYADPKGKEDGQSVKSKRKKSILPTDKMLVSVYNKIVELMELIPDLLGVQVLPDTLVLQISGLSVSPFFVENVGTLQLAALSVTSGVFSAYDKHREIILDDIFSSLARLPSSKRNFRSYVLSNGKSIQMVTALVLQLIQCIIKVPEIEEKKKEEPKEEVVEEPVTTPSKKKKKSKKRKSGRKMSEEEVKEEEEKMEEEVPPVVEEKPVTVAAEAAEKQYYAPDADVLIVTSYEQALRTAQNFLTAFLRKCSAKEQEDYRPLFENFIEDLLNCLNLPEWPSAESVLNLLGRLLVATFSSKQTDFAMRTVTIEYLGNIAAHLRRDAVESVADSDKLQKILIEQWKHDNGEDEPCPLFKAPPTPKKKSKKSKQDDLNESESDDEDEEKEEATETPPSQHDLIKYIKELQLALLFFLVESSEINQELVHARRFYLGQWIRDAQLACEQLVKNPPKLTFKDEDKETRARLTKDKEEAIAAELTDLEEKKEALKALLQQDIIKPTGLKSQRWSIHGSNAARIAQFLASSRSLSINFDIYLKKILQELQESAIGLRTKAMKALAAIISADPNLLSREDMRMGVHGRVVDQAASVREAAIDLVGRFVLDKPALTIKYYPMISERILDKGVGVRKRVIKILRDICIQQPDFPKLTEICIKLIRRIDDEDGIRELVAKVFMDLWFSDNKGETKDGLIKRVVSVTEAVAASPDQNCDWFKLLLNQYIKPGDEVTLEKDADQRSKVMAASKKMVDCLVDSVLKLEDFSAASATNSTRLVACLHTIYLFAEAVPELVTRHATILHPYLNMKCSQHTDYLVLYHVTRTLEIVLPLMDHPSEEFLASVEEDMMTLIMRHGQMIVQTCMSCLGAVINQITHNYKLAQDCFKRFFICLAGYKKQYTENPQDPELPSKRTSVIRSLFTVGLLCQHFEFDHGKNNAKSATSIQNQVFEILMFYANFQDEEIKHRAIAGLGFFYNRYSKLMLREHSKQLYVDILMSFDSPIKLKCQVLKNLQLHLQADELRVTKNNQDFRKELKTDGITDLKTYGDDKSTVSGAIAQLFLSPIHHCFLNKNVMIRTAAIQVISLVLRQGLVHPIQCIKFLIAMCTDGEQINRVKAEQQLIELDQKYAGFLPTQFYAGLKESFKLQTALRQHPIRGFRADPPISLLSHVYALIRTSKAHRRAQLVCMVKQFDDYKKIDINLLLYIADNLAHLTYQIIEEPLFVIHHIALLVSTSGTTYLEQAKDALYGREMAETIQDEDEEDIEDIERVEDLPRLTEVLVACQSCTLLILLRKHLMAQYNITDKRCHEFSPLEASNIYNKTIARQTATQYDPTHVMAAVQQLTLDVDYDSEEFMRSVLGFYQEFRDLMTQQDLSEFLHSDSEGETAQSGTKYYERRKEVAVKVRKARTPKAPKAPQQKKRKISKTPSKKPAKKRKRKVNMSSDDDTDDNEEDEDYNG